MTNSHTFFSLSAPAGSGKTFALAKHSVDMVRNYQKVLIAQPTIALMKQTKAAILQNDKSVTVTVIASELMQRNSNVLAKATGHIQNANNAKGEVLIISQDVLGRLPQSHRQFWHLFVDEIPGAFQPHELNISVTHKYLTEHLRAGDALVGDTVVIEAADGMGLRNLIENTKKDDALAVFHDLAADVLNPDKIVCTSKSQYDALVDGTGKAKLSSFFAIQTADFVSGFQSVTQMGAHLEETELYLLWQKLFNVAWKPHPTLTPMLRYTQHQNGQRVTFKYLIKGNWSQHFAGQQHDSGVTNFERICEVMEAELGQDFLWQANAKIKDHAFSYGMRLPTKSHGLNRPAFQAKHHVGLVMAINHSSAPAGFLKEIGFSQEEMKVTLQYQNEYQAMMRCSLRDPRATAPVTVCVVSEGSANWLAKHFPGSKVEQIASDITEPKAVGQPAEVKRSDAERMHDSRERRKAREAAAEGKSYEPTPWPGPKRDSVRSLSKLFK